MEKRNIPITLPNVGEDEWRALREPIFDGWLTQGPKVGAFEQAFAERHKVKHGLATSSCTTALHLALLVLGVGPGDEVIVPAFTWVATANAVLYCGATPVFVDVDRATFNLDVEDAARRVTPQTKAVIAVHLFGLCADIDALRASLPAEVRIVEDAACASGACYKDRPAGGLGDIGCFSFHPRKLITTGEGGMLTTNQDDLADMANKLRNHGASIPGEQRCSGPRPYILPEFDLLGFNYRMTDLHGAVGLVQLGKLDRFIEERNRWAAWYKEKLQDVEWLSLPEAPEGWGHPWQAYVTLIDPGLAPMARNDIMDRLERKGIATRPGTHAVHMLDYYRIRFGLKPEDYPGARYCAANSMAIPLHNRMSAEDYDYVATCLEQLGDVT